MSGFLLYVSVVNNDVGFIVALKCAAIISLYSFHDHLGLIVFLVFSGGGF